MGQLYFYVENSRTQQINIHRGNFIRVSVSGNYFHFQIGILKTVRDILFVENFL